MVERIEVRCDNCGIIFEKQNYNQHYCCDECRRQGSLKREGALQTAESRKPEKAEK